MNRKAFTLIELLIVVAIIAILAAIAVRSGQLADASLILKLVEELEPSNQAMLFNKARLLVLRGAPVAARDYFTRYQSSL